MSYFIKYEQNTSSRPALPLQAMYFLYSLRCRLAVVRQGFFPPGLYIGICTYIFKSRGLMMQQLERDN